MSGTAVPGAARFLPRAQRFPLQLPVLYRMSEESPWLGGTTRNVSRSGVLFGTDLLPEPSTSLELLLVMPSGVLGPAPANIHCRGRVVRTTLADGAETSALLAVKISDYSFVPSWGPSEIQRSGGSTRPRPGEN